MMSIRVDHEAAILISMHVRHACSICSVSYCMLRQDVVQTLWHTPTCMHCASLITNVAPVCRWLPCRTGILTTHLPAGAACMSAVLVLSRAILML